MTRRAGARARSNAAARLPVGRPRKFSEPMGLISLRLPAPMLATLERIAGARQVGVSDVIRELLGEALDRGRA